MEEVLRDGVRGAGSRRAEVSRCSISRVQPLTAPAYLLRALRPRRSAVAIARLLVSRAAILDYITAWHAASLSSDRTGTGRSARSLALILLIIITPQGENWSTFFSGAARAIPRESRMTRAAVQARASHDLQPLSVLAAFVLRSLPAATGVLSYILP